MESIPGSVNVYKFRLWKGIGKGTVAGLNMSRNRTLRQEI
jgi:hypothetical protein